MLRWLVPLLCGGLLLMGAFWFFQQPVVELTGTLPGELVTVPMTLWATISCELSQASDETTAVVLQALKDDPVLLQTDIMDFDLGASDDGFTVQVRAGVSTVLVRVDARAGPMFAAECTRLADVLERNRNNDLTQAVTAFVEGWAQPDEAGDRLSYVAAHRNPFGLTAFVRGPGHQLAALVDQTIFPCVREDANGTLSFLIPAGTTTFAVVNRPDRESLFAAPVHYTVQLTSN